LTAGVLVALIALFAVDPRQSRWFPHCPFHALTGFYCPGCGTLRAIHELLHGRVLEALSLNPLTVAFVPFLGYWLVSRAVCRLLARPRPTVFIPAFWIWGLFAVIVLFWVLRNIPLYPFSLLAPSG